MANLTLAEYKSLVLAYVQEDRDNGDTNELYKEADVVRAINAARQKLLRKVGLGLIRKTATQNATTGDITPPADLLTDCTVTLVVSATDRRPLQTVSVRHLHQTNPNWSWQTATHPTHVAYKITEDGLRLVLYPQPAATITDGLFFDYTARLDDLAADEDTCPILDIFPECQLTTLPAGALSILTLVEGGEADDQYVKFKAIFDEDADYIASCVNGLLTANAQYGMGR